MRTIARRIRRTIVAAISIACLRGFCGSCANNGCPCGCHG